MFCFIYLANFIDFMFAYFPPNRSLWIVPLTLAERRFSHVRNIQLVNGESHFNQGFQLVYNDGVLRLRTRPDFNSKTRIVFVGAHSTGPLFREELHEYHYHIMGYVVLNANSTIQTWCRPTQLVYGTMLEDYFQHTCFFLGLDDVFVGYFYTDFQIRINNRLLNSVVIAFQSGNIQK